MRHELGLHGLMYAWRTMVGVMDDNGRLPGLIKFWGGGGRYPGG